MPVVAAVAIGTVAAGAIGASMQASAAKKAANTQATASMNAAQLQYKSSQDQLALQKEIYQDQRGIYAPTATLGAGALARQYIMAGGDTGRAQDYYRDQTKALNGQPGDDPGLGGYTSSSWMTSDPGYAFRQAEGQRAIERSASARGGLFSGRTGRELTRYGQDYASNEFMNAFNRLGAISGTGQTATQNIGGAGQNYAQGGAQSLRYGSDAMASGVLGAGNARASGYLAQGNAWGNFFGETVPGALGMFAYGGGGG